MFICYLARKNEVQQEWCNPIRTAPKLLHVIGSKSSKAFWEAKNVPNVPKQHTVHHEAHF